MTSNLAEILRLSKYLDDSIIRKSIYTQDCVELPKLINSYLYLTEEAILFSSKLMDSDISSEGKYYWHLVNTDFLGILKEAYESKN
jgi:hypothetical protein